MQNNYTEEELLQFIYNELDPIEYHNIENELKENYELKKEFEIYNKLIKHLDELREKPNPTTIEMIMEYSRSKPLSSR